MVEYLETIEVLLGQHGKLETILESSINGVIEFSPDGKILSMNPAARNIFSLPEVGAAEYRISQLLPQESLDDFTTELLHKKKELVMRKEQVKVGSGDKETTKYLEMKVVSIPDRNRNWLVALVIDRSDVMQALNNREYFISALFELIEDLKVDSRAVIYTLARIVDIRDHSTGEHLERVEAYTRLLASAYRERYFREDRHLTENYVEDMALSSVLHDIGKVGVTDSILQKPGKLDNDEFDLIKTHTIIAGEALKNHKGKRDYLDMGREIALNHHEKWDGTGYPNQLKGESIPLSARIVSLCDVYDALTSERPYKDAFSHKKAVSIITADRGKAFDPRIVDLFLTLLDDFNRIRYEKRDSPRNTES